jgi:RimJ/RimL family protein N-acetyltransferase
MTMKLTPVVLEGSVVRMEPLSLDHLPALCEVGLEPSLWALTYKRVASEADMRDYVEEALAEQKAGTALPFATVERASGRVIGSSRFGNYVETHRRVEIGWTWIAPAWQRTAVNTEAKLLMLTHAFETLDCRRVELKTSSKNARSRAAMLRIGASEEGTLRQHMINGDGSSRDSVYFSILDGEWPQVKEKLNAMLRQPRTV